LWVTSQAFTAEPAPALLRTGAMSRLLERNGSGPGLVGGGPREP
jgi:hypothetical protein